MNLRDYLHFERITVTDFAKSIKYGRTYINDVVAGTKKAGRKLIEAIEDATNGKVTEKDLMKTYKERQKAEESEKKQELRS